MKKQKREQMNIEKIYDLAIKKGIGSDFRSKEDIYELFRKEKEKYDKLDTGDKDDYDTDRLVNPYSDTRVLNMSKNKPIAKVLC